MQPAEICKWWFEYNFEGTSYMVHGTTASRNFHSSTHLRRNFRLKKKNQDDEQHKGLISIPKLYSHSLKVICIILHIRGQCEGTAACPDLLSLPVYIRMTIYMVYTSIYWNDFYYKLF